MLLGHSYGGYLARGVVARRPDAVLGLALLCPVAERSGNVPEHDVVRQDADAYDELEPAQRAGFEEYFVVRTPATARRYRDHVVPGTTLVDEAASSVTPTRQHCSSATRTPPWQSSRTPATRSCTSVPTSSPLFSATGSIVLSLRRQMTVQHGRTADLAR
jgi:pimeloyl-ACP methyl ester carboxylesterase